MTAAQAKKVQRKLLQVVDPQGVFDGETLTLVPEGGIFEFVGPVLPKEHIARPAPKGAEAGQIIPLNPNAERDAKKAPRWTTPGFKEEQLGVAAAKRSDWAEREAAEQQIDV